MGIQSLQDFIDSSSFHRTLQNAFEEHVIELSSNLIVVHADSCIRQFYQEHVDWICGGQWSELFQSVEQFVQSFRQSEIEVVVFFDGTLNDYSLNNWSYRHRFIRETVKESLSHIIHYQSFPFKTISKKFVPPGALRSALRLAFRACNVLVCCAINDVYKESILYSKDINSLGILGNDANYFIYRAPRQLALCNMKWLKKPLQNCKLYETSEIIKFFNLKEECVPYLASLLGNFVISDRNLSSFYWDLIEEDSPLKKIQANIVGEALLPPSEVRLNSVVKFLKSNTYLLTDVDALAKRVFESSKSISVDEGARKLRQIISFYQDCISATKSNVCSLENEGQLTASGFPLPMSGFQKQVWSPLQNYSEDKRNADSQTCNEISQKPLEDPEKVLKQGTLEEAAQALEQLELNESAVVADQKNFKDVVVDDERPSTKMEKEINYQSGYEYTRYIDITLAVSTIDAEVLNIARKRHQSGQMCPEILQLLVKQQVILEMTIDDEVSTTRLPIPLIYRPLRQLVYGILFEVQHKQWRDSEDDDGSKAKDVYIKEWCVYADRTLIEPDEVLAKGMTWGVPSLRQLWLGTASDDNANRLKAFLSCMKSDTVNIANTGIVPQHLMILCCVLRYLIQQETAMAILTKQDLDAFLSQALSVYLTTEHNSHTLSNIKLNQIDARCVQLAAIFMKGVEVAILANDACGSPIPWQFCCPWNFFNGKLFHSRWLQAHMEVDDVQLCEGKPLLAEKLKILRWCITEGLGSKHSIPGLPKTSYNPFAQIFPVPPMYGVLQPFAQSPMHPGRMRSRGPGSKRPVHGSGGTLHVAGYPVAHWNGNKYGIGYSKHGPKVLVGGTNCVDLPSSHRNSYIGRSSYHVNRGRGLLETPLLPWQPQQPDVFPMKGVKKHHTRVYSSRTRHRNQGADLWNGSQAVDVLANKFDRCYGRGEWINESGE